MISDTVLFFVGNLIIDSYLFSCFTCFTYSVIPSGIFLRFTFLLYSIDSSLFISFFFPSIETFLMSIEDYSLTFRRYFSFFTNTLLVISFALFGLGVEVWILSIKSSPYIWFIIVEKFIIRSDEMLLMDLFIYFEGLNSEYGK